MEEFFADRLCKTTYVPDWQGKLEDIQSICDNEQNQNYIEPQQQWMVLADFIHTANLKEFDTK